MIRVLALLSLLMSNIAIQAAENDIRQMAEQGDALAQAHLKALTSTNSAAGLSKA